MEQARYWMLTKRKHDHFGSHVFAASQNYGDSWEEQAFAEDAAGALGGCVWPPRSYSCSFCRREFKSAQALGGHMNVHRRDRARLKQSPKQHSTTDTHVLPPHPHILSPQQSLDTQYYSPPPPPPTRICSSLCYEHSSDSQGGFGTSSPVRVSTALPTKTKIGLGLDLEEKLILKNPSPIFFSSSILSENYPKKDTMFSSSGVPQAWSNLVADKCLLHVSDLTNGDKITSRKLTSKSNGRATNTNQEEYVKADLSKDQGLNLLLCPTPTHSNAFSDDDNDDDDDDEEFPSCNNKRRRIVYHETSSNKFFLKSSSAAAVERCKLSQYSDVAKLSPNSTIGDLDLELRLGDPSKV